MNNHFSNKFKDPGKLKDKGDIKIFILYLMQNLTVPLRFSELNDIAVTDGMVGCIEFAECFAELVDTGNIRPLAGSLAGSLAGADTGEGADTGAAAPESAMPPPNPGQAAPLGQPGQIGQPTLGQPDPEAFFEITPRGRHAATTLQSKLLHYIRDKSLKSALRHLQFGREGGGIRTEQTLREDGRYDVTCIARDGKGDETLRVSVIADSAERAERIRDTFNERPEHIYRAIFALLSGEANFLFDL